MNTKKKGYKEYLSIDKRIDELWPKQYGEWAELDKPELIGYRGEWVTDPRYFNDKRQPVWAYLLDKYLNKSFNRNKKRVGTEAGYFFERRFNTDTYVYNKLYSPIMLSHSQYEELEPQYKKWFIKLYSRHWNNIAVYVLHIPKQYLKYNIKKVYATHYRDIVPEVVKELDGLWYRRNRIMDKGIGVERSYYYPKHLELSKKEKKHLNPCMRTASLKEALELESI